MEEKKKYLECLLYRKSCFLSQIVSCKNLRTPELSKVFYILIQASLLPSKIKEFGNLTAMKDLATFDKDIKKSLQEEYEERKLKQKEFEDSKHQKQQNVIGLKNKENLLTKIPENVKKLENVLGGFMEVFGIKEYKHSEQVLISKKLPETMFIIYNQFISLLESGTEANISVILNGITHTYLELKGFPDKKEKSKYDISPIEIVLKISKSPEEEEKMNQDATFIGANISDIISQVYPFTLTIRYLEYFNALLISNDPRSFFNSDQIFSCLLNEEIGRDLFVMPSLL